MTYQEFCKNEHAKRVKHFVNFINSIDRKPVIADAVKIFGFNDASSKMIFDDAVNA